MNFRAIQLLFCLLIMLQAQRLHWIKPPENMTLRTPYLKARLLRPLAQNSLQVQVQTDRGPVKFTVPSDTSFEMAAEKDYQDMCEMNILNEPEVLFNLIRRYNNDDIFTNIGATLISINPYCQIQRLFNQKVLQEAKNLARAGKIKEFRPHVYQFAGRAFQAMLTNGGKQALVISGQSGAGKTQSTKYCLQLLTALREKKTNSIQEKILAANPILEAFGNSKTVRNQNSSRFGKYMKMYFEGEHILGAEIQSYLLQKSRVVSLSPNQRSFHAFYALTCSGEFQAMKPECYLMLKQSGCYHSSHSDDKAYFAQINKAFTQIGFQEDQIKKNWLILLAILEMGNIQFDQSSHLANQSKPCELLGTKNMQKIADILQIEINKLEKMLLYQRRKFLKEFTFIPYNKNNAKTNKEAFSKALYQSLFQFILKKIQVGIKPHHAVNSSKEINILDIFGFQKFTQNSFEQFCINYANQRLLRLYNNYVFQNEIQILRQDGLQEHLGGLASPSNEGLLSLINGKMSLFSIINDMSIVQFNDLDIINGFRNLKSPDIAYDKLKTQFFCLSHTPCKVDYSITGFKAKNQDKVNDQMGELINNIWGQSRKEVLGKTILVKFNKQIDDLMNELQSSQVHFMRCIKPNQLKKAKDSDQKYILTQIRYLGVLQTIFIRKNTFPARKTYQEFRRQYDFVFKSMRKQVDDKLAIQQVLKKYSDNKADYLLGNQRVYITSQIQQKITQQFYRCVKLRDQKIKVLQRATKIWLFRHKTMTKLKQFMGRLNILKTIPKKLELKLLLLGFQSIQEKHKEQLIKIKQKKQQDRIKAFWEAKKIREEQQKQKNQQSLENKMPSKQISLSQQTNKIQNKSEHFSGMSEGFRLPFNEPKIISQNYGMSLLLNQTDLVSQNVIEPRQNYSKPDTPSRQLMGKTITFDQKYISLLNKSTSGMIQNFSQAFEGQFDVGPFEGSAQIFQKLKSILSQQFKFQAAGNEQEIFSPLSSHNHFKLSQLSEEILNTILQFPVQQYLKSVLRKRTTFFGFNKSYEQILVYKPTSLSKSMTILSNQQEQRRSIDTFDLFLKIAEEVKIEKVLTYIQQFLSLFQNISYKLKIQVMVQLLRQSTVKVQLSAIRIYQTMVAFIHIFNPSQEIIKTSLQLFYRKLKEKNLGVSQRQYLLYLFSSLVKKLLVKGSVGYLPINFQIMALICRRQISVPVYLTTGNSVFIYVESFNTFADLKSQCLRKFGISQRWDSGLFGFFQVVHFDDDDIQQAPIRQTNIVWDMVSYWQLTRQKYSQNGINPPVFFLVFKLRYSVATPETDEQCIQLCYSQIYFDYFMGKIRLSQQLMFFLGASIYLIKYSHKKVQQIVIGLLPIYFSKQFTLQKINKALKQAIKVLQSLSLNKMQMKYKFIKICSQYPLTMSVFIPTQDELQLYLKPRHLYLKNKQDELHQLITIPLKHVIRWQIEKEYFLFEAAGPTKEENKVYKLLTDCSTICNEFFHGLSAVTVKQKQQFPSFKKK